jgi:hypothetical protein
MVSIRTMSVASHNEGKKSEPSSISRPTGRSICLTLSPNSSKAGRILLLEKTGKEPHRALFRVGKSDFALELHHTKGMAQFGAPEICLSKQPNADPLMVDYRFHVAQSVLTLHHSIPDSRTYGQPQGKLKMEQSGVPGGELRSLNPPAPDEPPLEIQLAGLRHEAARRLPVIVYHGTFVPW